MCKVAQVLESVPVGEIDGVCVCDILLFKYARLTSCDVERSFSQYKSLFRDNRHAFVMENLEMTFVVHCNSRPTTSTQVWLITTDIQNKTNFTEISEKFTAHTRKLKITVFYQRTCPKTSRIPMKRLFPVHSPQKKVQSLHTLLLARHICDQ
ncbi:hypothetical protein ANN_14859 [Periplaneta americana]|uniref:Uncharacterized protein n=1 Tax=Periplaneta americana TaxID=6978 RepID=A0ABQ8SYX6_PERAM|nr:hypothetical protein ANN_14859 [Periplaneta americana]